MNYDFLKTFFQLDISIRHAVYDAHSVSLTYPRITVCVLYTNQEKYLDNDAKTKL